VKVGQSASRLGSLSNIFAAQFEKKSKIELKTTIEKQAMIQLFNIALQLSF